MRPKLQAWAVAAVVGACSVLTPGCATTQYYERARLSDRALRLDGSTGLVYIRNKIEGAREASFGGFGASAAGGCGCE